MLVQCRYNAAGIDPCGLCGRRVARHGRRTSARPHYPKAALGHPLQRRTNLHVRALAKRSVLLKQSRKLIHLGPRREKVMEDDVSHGTSERR